MAINVVISFTDRATVVVTTYVYNEKDILVDPSEVRLTLIDPNGEKQVDAQPMDRDDTGIYVYYYHKGETTEPMLKGQWLGKVDVIDGSGAYAIITPADFSFMVK